MCGRYASGRGADLLAAHFDAELDSDGPAAAPSWNVAPTDAVSVVAERDRRRVLRTARWGLEPAWAAGRRGRPLINARSETVAGTPAFRAAFARRRCLVPADGWYEWARDGAAKQAWFLTSSDGEPLALAGVYEVGPAGWSCAVLTTAAPAALSDVHDRAPLLVAREHWRRWLDPSVPDPGARLLDPLVAEGVRAWPVGPAVGDVRNDGPELVAPAAPAPQQLAVLE